MSNKKATKRALLTSILAICLCLVMLIGSTFAWFTDTASTGVNSIQSGTLKLALDMEVGEENGTIQWDNAEGKTLEFKKAAGHESEAILWEPGCTYELPALRIRNDGNLALKYKIAITGITGNAKLLEAIEFSVKKGDAGTAEKLEGWEGILLPAGKTATEGTEEVVGQTEPIIISGHMKEDAGNDYMDQMLTGIAITVNATQYTYEYDSTGNQYDAGAAAALPTMSTTVGELNTITLDDLKKNESGNAVVEVPMGTVAVTDIAYTDNNSGYTGKGVMLGSTNLNKHSAAPAGVGEYTFIFKNGTIEGTVNGYSSIDGATTNSVYMLVPGNSDVVFENMTFNGVVSFDIQKYTSPWSNLNSITIKNCTFNGIIVGTCPASNVTFNGCTFNAYTNESNANNSNPIWWRSDMNDLGAEGNRTPIETFTFVNNKVTGTRPIKFERVGMWDSKPVFTFKNNTFDISAQADDTNTKNMAINIGNVGAYTLIDEGNTIVGTTASLYTALTTGAGENKYNEISGSKVLDGNGNPKTITAMVWKTTTGETFEMKSVD